MIPSVDRLEGFRAAERVFVEGHPSRTYGYHRTLSWLHILPSNFGGPFFPSASEVRRGSWDERDLKLPTETWKDYPKIPCWIYCSVGENSKSDEAKKSPMIWDGVVFKQERI